MSDNIKTTIYEAIKSRPKSPPTVQRYQTPTHGRSDMVRSGSSSGRKRRSDSFSLGLDSDDESPTDHRYRRTKR
ncbi:hypothetical protein ANO14919_110490 [Xylariales sp. No.14919]|nr:hypothetical protein ANO14919_110490 [Xylariales sp. No.14919]